MPPSATLARAFALGVLLALPAGPVLAVNDYFVDEFDGTSIDPTHWAWGGQVGENGGYLHLDRESPDDFVQTISTYDGDWTIDLDTRLNYIVWNDMFHGIDVTDDTGAWGAGLSFGYSVYGSLYLGVHSADGNQIGYFYGLSNATGQWHRWTLRKSGGTVRIEVDGQPIPFGPGAVPVPDGITIRLPGYYSDGDGGPHIGMTASEVDHFEVAAPSVSVPETEGATRTASWGKVKSLFH